MEMKICNKISYSSITSAKNFSTRKTSTAVNQSIKDSFSRSAKCTNPLGLDSDQYSQLQLFIQTLKGTSTPKGAVNIGGTPIRLNDYSARAKEGIESLHKDCSCFNNIFGEKLANSNVPKDIELEFDYDVNNNKALPTKISDESYKSDVQKLLDEMTGNVLLTNIANGSRLLNGAMTSVYYRGVSKSLNINFNQDILELYLNEDNSLDGANDKLSRALEKERNSSDFDANESYRFITKPLYSVLKRIIADTNASQNISHMIYTEQKISTNDGYIKLGRTNLNNIDSPLLIKAACAGHWQLMDIWAENENMF